MSKTIVLNDDNFESEVLNSEIPVLVDLWAEWCGPCRALAPVIEEIAEDYDGKLKVGKLNVDENPGVPSAYDIRSIPTLLVFKDGAVQDRLVGALPKNHIVDLIESMLEWKKTG
ncbi:MAG: thioredoxin [Deltaproteobacteria bacterium]|nr:thioredoxin [Deltaproteobacteria bacterium]